MAYEILFWLKTLLFILLKKFLQISFFQVYSVVFKNIVLWHCLKTEFAISISRTKRMETQVDDKIPADVINRFQTQNWFVAVSFEEDHADMGNDLVPSDSQGVCAFSSNFILQTDARSLCFQWKRSSILAIPINMVRIQI